MLHDFRRTQRNPWPLKAQYQSDPAAAMVTLRASGRVSEGIACKVDTGRTLIEAGLHPATGGNGTQACSGDMLLEALVACAGVTLRAVATAIGVELRDAMITAEGDLDFAALSPSQRKLRSASRRSGSASNSRPMPRRKSDLLWFDSPNATVLCCRP